MPDPQVVYVVTAVTVVGLVAWVVVVLLRPADPRSSTTGAPKPSPSPPSDGDPAKKPPEG